MDLRRLLHPRRIVAATLLSAALLACNPGAETVAPPVPDEPTPEARLTRPTGVPILLVGIDAADWELIDELIARGELPRLAALSERGSRSVLRSEEPLLSPILWTTMATGRAPLEHGVLDFLEVDPVNGGAMPVSARQRQVPALWDLFSRAGLDATVIAWWGSWPAYPLRGRMVSDRVSYTLYQADEEPGELPGLFYPGELGDRLLPLRVAAASVDLEMLGDLARVGAARLQRADQALQAGASPYDDPLNYLRSVLAGTLSYHRMARALLEEHQSALFAVYYQGVDEVNHRFAHCRAPALASCPDEEARAFGETVDAFYRLQDRLLGELLDRVRPETAVLVVSDHGFLSGGARRLGRLGAIRTERGVAWHRLAGIWLLAGPVARPGPAPMVGLRDVAPTVLYLAGIPLSEELAGRPALDAIDPAFRASHPPSSIPAYGPWEGIAAVAARTGPEADRRALQKLEALGYLSVGATTTAPSGEAATRATARRLTMEGGLRLKRGELDEARRLLRRAVDLDPTYHAARIGLTMHLLRNGRAAEAVPHLRALLPVVWEVSPGLYPEAARAFLTAGLGGEGLQLFREAAAEHPDVGTIRVGVALLQEGQGDAAGGRRTLRAILRDDPTAPEAMVALLSSLERAGRSGEGVPLLQAALRSNPRSAPHHRWLGRISEGAGRYQEAALHYIRASDAAPAEYGPLDDLGRATALAGRDLEAAAIFENASRVFPDEPRAPFNLGVVRERAGDPAGALQAFREAERRGMRNPELYGRAGAAAAAAGLTEEAGELLQRSLEMAPDQPGVKAALEDLARR